MLTRGSGQEVDGPPTICKAPRFSEIMMNRISFRPSSMVTCKGNNSASKPYVKEVDDQLHKQHEDAIGEYHEATQKRARHLRDSAVERGLDEVSCRYCHKAAAHHSAFGVTGIGNVNNNAKQASAKANIQATAMHRAQGS